MSHEIRSAGSAARSSDGLQLCRRPRLTPCAVLPLLSCCSTPMNAVLGLARLMLDTELSAEQSSYLSMITNSGKLLLTIISDVLDFSRIEENRLELEWRRFSLLDCCENAIHLVHDMANSKSIDLAYSVERSTPSHVYGDSSRLQQVLLNLLSNACKFTPSHGQIAVSLRCRFLDPSAVQQLAQAAAAQAQAQSPFLDSPASAAGSNGFAAQAAEARARSAVAPAGSAASAVRRILSSTPQPAPSRRLQLATAAPGSSQSASSISPSALGDEGGLPGLSAPSKSASSSPVHTPAAAPGTPPSSFTPPYRQYVELEFSVRDTGLGMSEETQSRLFKSFSQGDSSVVRRFGGTGLGLAISKRLAMAMHGRMWCSSRVGEGSTFFFTIQSAVASPLPARRRLTSAEVAARELQLQQQQPAPFALSPLASPAPSPPTATRSALSSSSVLPNVHRLSEAELLRLSGRRCLLVSDLPASREAMVQLLTSYELQLQTAASIREAEELAASGSVQLPHGFILDYRGCSVHSQQQADAVDRMVRAFMAAGRQAAAAEAQQPSGGGEKQQQHEEEKQRDERQAAAAAGSGAAPQSSAFTFSLASAHVAGADAASSSLPSSSSPSSASSAAPSPLLPVVLFLTARQAVAADDQAGAAEWGSSIKPTATGGQADDEDEDDREDEDEDDAAATQPEGELSSEDEADSAATAKEAAAGSLVPRGGHEADVINHLVLARLSNLEQQQSRAADTDKKERRSRRQQTPTQPQHPAAVRQPKSTLAKAVGLQSLSAPDPLRPPDSAAAAYAAFELAKPFHQADLLHTLAEHLPQDEAAGDGSTAAFIRRWETQRSASTASSSSGSERSHELSPTSGGDGELGGGGWERLRRERSDPVPVAAEAAGSEVSTAASQLRKGGASSRAVQAHSQLAALRAGLPPPVTQQNGTEAAHAAPPAQPKSASPQLQPLSPLTSSSTAAATTSSSSSSSASSRSVVKATSRQGQQQRQQIRAIAADHPMRLLLAEDNPVSRRQTAAPRSSSASACAHCLPAAPLCLLSACR